MFIQPQVRRDDDAKDSHSFCNWDDVISECQWHTATRYSFQIAPGASPDQLNLVGIQRTGDSKHYEYVDTFSFTFWLVTPEYAFSVENKVMSTAFPTSQQPAAGLG